MNAQYAEKAIPLVTVKDGQYNINAEALEVIRSVEGPLIVIGVAGLYRTGKSYLLNRVILNRDKGFGVGSSVNACTKGIWMWAKPIKTQTKSGKLANVLVLDSEGLGAIDQDSAHDCRIFSLVLLLTSVFVFNSVGAIDENAVSNLSLVINLTKHIETSSRSKEDEAIDYDELHKYFPSFMWVLRDFALQLVDEYGSSITAREYLENALQEQNGISDDVEQKNRIRRLIKNFFRERDCTTLVRPTTEEEELQALDSMSFDQLRPEFVEQALELRKSLFTLENFKKFRGRFVDGSMLASIVENYVTTINAGAVPNLENTWIYICKDHNKKLLLQCQKEFDATMENKVKSQIPLSEAYIADIYAEAKDVAIKRFENKALGEDRATYIDIIKRHCKEAKESISEDNDRDFEMILYNELSNRYADTLFKKLMNKNYKGLNSYVEELRKFVDGFMGGGFDGPAKAERVYKFAMAKGLEGAELVYQTAEADLQDQLHNKETARLRIINEYEKQIAEKDDSLQNIRFTITEMDSSIYDKDLKIKGLSEANTSLKLQLDEASSRFNSAMRDDAEKYQNKLKDLQAHLIEVESSLEDQTKLNKDQQSRYETQIALLEGKLSHLSNVEREMRELREKNLRRAQDLEEDYKSRFAALRDESETRLSEAQSQLRRLTEQNSILEGEMNRKYLLNESLQVDMSKRDEALKSYRGHSEAIITELRDKLHALTAERDTIPERESRLSTELADVTERLSVAEESLRDKEEELKALIAHFDKEKTLIKQNEEFYEIKLSEMEDEIAELKKVKDVTINSFQTKSVSKGEMMRQLQECKIMYEDALRTANEEHTAELNEVKERLKLVVEHDEVALAELKKKKEDLLIQCQELSHELSSCESERQKLSEQLRATEESKAATINDLKNVYDRRIRELEGEIESLNSMKDSDIAVANKNTEERIRKLREIYEVEKTKLEQRIVDDRQRAQKQIDELHHEMNEKLKSELSSKDDELDAMREQIEEASIQLGNFESLIEEERLTFNEKILELKRIHENDKKELKDAVDRELGKLKRDIETREQEKKELVKSNGNLKNIVHEKEACIHNMQREAEKLAEINKREMIERDSSIQDLITSQEEIQQKLERVQVERTKVKEELVEVQMKLQKELALAQQRNDFDKKKIIDLELALNSVESNSDEAQRKIRVELEEDIRALKAQMTQREEELKIEVAEKSKVLKELETSSTLTINELEKTNQLLADQVSFTEGRKAELEAKYKHELEASSLELKKLRDSHVHDRKALMEDLNNLRKAKYELDITLTEVQAKADKDKAVDEGRIQFLEQQNRKLKSELSEHHHTYDMMYEKLHQYRQADNDENEKNHTEKMNDLENRYNQKISDMKSKHSETVDYLKQKVREQDKEIKKLMASKQDILDQRYGSGIIHEKKINELLENERAMQQEIQSLKADRDHTNVAFQIELEKQKESIKKRITEIEQKFKRSEAEKNQETYEHEKMRTRWHIEKDNLTSQYNDALERIEKLEKQKDSSNKELEKMRRDYKELRKSTLNMSSFGFNKNKVAQYFASKNKTLDIKDGLSDSN